MGRRRFALTLVLVLAGLVAAAGVAYAQFGPGGFGQFGGLRGEQGDPAEFAPPQQPDRDFVACRIL